VGNELLLGGKSEVGPRILNGDLHGASRWLRNGAGLRPGPGSCPV
jgi:hypothetical protein